MNENSGGWNSLHHPTHTTTLHHPTSSFTHFPSFTLPSPHFTPSLRPSPLHHTTFYLSPHSLLHQKSQSYPRGRQRTVTLVGLRMSTGSGDHLLFDSSQTMRQVNLLRIVPLSRRAVCMVPYCLQAFNTALMLVVVVPTNQETPLNSFAFVPASAFSSVRLISIA
ncbi:hypothetical protein EVAR_95021_1 [Eumeta japonica]|uniref:Uncharacterized protein n=1 Tax=Eumeta variegata TaxID=151549 RepID=A0A4C1VUI0_EUMVA|nr:hypothetical protein EVAR_95021_1 [Eumeta japonica]